MRCDAYENAHFKEMMKTLRDQHVLRHVFKSSDRVLLFDLQLHLFPTKFHSRWTRPFIIKLYCHGAIEIKNSKIGHVFKVTKNISNIF